jgi:hypothetical protein
VHALVHAGPANEVAPATAIVLLIHMCRSLEAINLNREFRLAMQRLQGLSCLPPGVHTVICVVSKDSEHAHTWPTPNALRVLHHESIVEVGRRALRVGGVDSFTGTHVDLRRTARVPPKQAAFMTTGALSCAWTTPPVIAGELLGQEPKQALLSEPHQLPLSSQRPPVAPPTAPNWISSHRTK